MNDFILSMCQIITNTGDCGIFLAARSITIGWLQGKGNFEVMTHLQLRNGFPSPDNIMLHVVVLSMLLLRCRSDSPHIIAEAGSMLGAI